VHARTQSDLLSQLAATKADFEERHKALVAQMEQQSALHDHDLKVKVETIKARDAQYAKSLADTNQRHKSELDKLHSSLSDQIKQQADLLKARDHCYASDLQATKTASLQSITALEGKHKQQLDSFDLLLTNKEKMYREDLKDREEKFRTFVDRQSAKNEMSTKEISNSYGLRFKEIQN